MKMTPAVERYILHWGEMGTRWGVNRSVSQIHALLYLSPKPLTAEEISETLGIARSNVSTSLKELLSWQLVRTEQKLGDRRDHFTAEKDLWTMLMTIVAERKRREIDPTLTVLRQTSLEAADDSETDAEVKARMEDMLAFVDTLSDWYGQMNRLPKPTLVALMKMGSKVARFLPGSKKG
ncbi:MAG: GbsR/MarR family transcriptional regulator [Alphaproteobacteria bacterium]|nr:MAG: GbsR/MarR family transcriptional regulator [Alphaproteobacteria bacterium]